MRASRISATLLLVALVVGAPLGCFVGDELNKSSELADKAAQPKKGQPGFDEDKAKPQPQAVAKAEDGGKGGGEAKKAAPTGAAWWKTAVSLGSEESTADIVGCKLARGVEFMEKDDCLSRGGVPQ